MAQQHSDSIDLQAKLASAMTNYRETWQVVDSELYDLCRRRPGQRDFADVYGKVAVIGRVYSAGIARSSRAQGDRETEVARGLIEQAALIEGTLHDLGGRQLDRATAGEIIGLHGRVTRGLCSHTGDRWLTSFVSKYLHFHCDIVPVYDSLATKAIGQFVNWGIVSRVRTSIAEPEGRVPVYYNFVTAFLVMRERIAAETSIPATVKDVDYLLWQSA